MSERVRILGLGPHEWAVDVTEGTTATRHRVVVDEEFLDQAGLLGVDEQTLVDATFHFLLEREKPTEIHDEFPLSVVAAHFPGYVDELRARLAG